MMDDEFVVINQPVKMSDNYLFNFITLTHEFFTYQKSEWVPILVENNLCCFIVAYVMQTLDMNFAWDFIN